MTDRLAAAFARFVGTRSDAELDALMRGWRRRLLLWGIFAIAVRRLDRSSLDEPALIEIRIRDGDRGGDRRALLIGRGRTRVSRHALGEPDSVVNFEPVAFLRFAAGQESARDLFLARRLSVDGSLLLAAELPTLFRRPTAAAAAPETLAD